MIGEFIAQAVGEVVGYATGRVILAACTPHILLAPRSNSERHPKQGFFAFTYVHQGRRYYFDDTVVAVGIVFWLVILVVVGITLSM